MQSIALHKSANGVLSAPCESHGATRPTGNMGLEALATNHDNGRSRELGVVPVVRVYQLAVAVIVLALPLEAGAATPPEFHGLAVDLVPTAAEAGYANRVGRDTPPPAPGESWNNGFEAGWDGNYNDGPSLHRLSEFGVTIYKTTADARRAFARPGIRLWRRPSLLGLRRDVRVKIRSDICGVTGTTSRQLWCTNLITQRRNVITYTLSGRETPPATRLEARGDGIRIHRLVYRKMVALSG